MNPTSAQTMAFERDGYLHLPRLLDPALIDAARRRVDTVLTSTARVFGRCPDCDGIHHDFHDPQCGFARRPFVQVFNAWAEHAAFRALSLSPVLAAVGRSLLGCANVRILHDQLLLKRPGDQETGVHVDAYHWPFRGRACTVWIPLVRVTPSMGVIEYYLGSHRRFHAPEVLEGLTDDNLEAYTRDWLAALELQPRAPELEFLPGDVAVHDGWTAHRARSNDATSIRPVLAVVLMDAESRRTEALGELQRSHVEMFHWQSVPPGAMLRVPMCPVL